MEGAPTRPEHLPEATARFECMRELSQGHALLAADDLILREARLLYGESEEQLPIFRDDGDWLPSHLRELTFPSREQILREMLATMGREQRRKVERTVFAPDGRLLPAASALLARGAVDFADRWESVTRSPRAPASALLTSSRANAMATRWFGR